MSDVLPKTQITYHEYTWYAVGVENNPAKDLNDYICSVDGCDKPLHGKTYCKSHGDLMRRYGALTKPPCEVEGCGNPRHGKRYCQAHYRLWKKYGKPEVLTPEEKRSPGPAPQPEKPRSRYNPTRIKETKKPRFTLEIGGTCRQGHELTEENVYVYHREDRGKERVICRQCALGPRADSRRLQNYGLTEQEYEDLLVKQDFSCAICGRAFDGSSKIRTPHIDHDHSCCSGNYSCGECVRGVLCDGCNKGLGYFRDSPHLCVRAAQYVMG